MLNVQELHAGFYTAFRRDICHRVRGVALLTDFVADTNGSDYSL